MVERCVKRSKQPEWFSDDIQEDINLKDKFTGTSDIESAKYWYNRVHKAKYSYYREFISASLCDSKLLWEIIWELAPKSSTISPTTLNTGDQVISDPQELVDSFNEFSQI